MQLSPNLSFCSAYSFEGPRTLQLKLQKKVVIVYTHDNSFSQLNDFFNSLMYGQFSIRFFKKNLCENLCMCKGLDIRCFKADGYIGFIL